MSGQQTTGRAALVQNNLPTSKTVSAATNATPIVVTTTAPHKLNVNEVFQITGALGNLAANGVFLALAVTPTTVTLGSYPGGTNVAGSGAWTSGGTLQSLGFGITVPVPVDLSDPLQAASVNVPHEAELDRLAFLWQALVTITSIAVSFSGITKFVGRLIPSSARVLLTDGNHTVSTYPIAGAVIGRNFELPEAGATRTITITKAAGTFGATPLEGETMSFVEAALATPGPDWIFKRDDATTICTFTGTTDIVVACSVTFEYSGGKWRLGSSSGTAYSVTDLSAFGVVPNASA